VLRGRKVYPHQRDLEMLDWSQPTAADREYLAERSDQNATVEGWVPRDARFTFTIEVTNLADVELGALVWLFTRSGMCFKLGAGRPLGFGSVRLELVGADLARGRDLAERYRAFGDAPAPTAPDLTALATRFEEALAGGASATSVPSEAETAALVSAHLVGADARAPVADRDRQPPRQPVQRPKPGRPSERPP
jgi:hypothetical protein